MSYVQVPSGKDDVYRRVRRGLVNMTSVRQFCSRHMERLLTQREGCNGFYKYNNLTLRTCLKYHTQRWFRMLTNMKNININVFKESVKLTLSVTQMIVIAAMSYCYVFPVSFSQF